MKEDLIVFLDRDGVINRKKEKYVKNINEFEFLPKIFEAIKIINELDFKIIIITNQSVINRNIISKEELDKIHEYMLKKFNEKSCQILKIYYCPHKPDENCKCRKPNTGMIIEAMEEFKINLSNSVLIGDSESDIETAKRMKMKSIKIESNGSLIEEIDNIKKMFFK